MNNGKEKVRIKLFHVDYTIPISGTKNGRDLQSMIDKWCDTMEEKYPNFQILDASTCFNEMNTITTVLYVK